MKVLKGSRFCLKNDDAISKLFTNRVTRSLLEMRSPHFYVRPSASSGRTKKIEFHIF